MKRRSFIKKTVAGSGLAVAAPLSGLSERREAPALVTHNTTLMETVISIDKLPKEVKVLQISDAHISCDTDKDIPYQQFSARMNKGYQRVRHYESGEYTKPADNFKQILQSSARHGVDLIALTGDIINYPSEAAVDFVKTAVASTGIPYMYTAGNHDWHYEGMPGSADQLRNEWCNSALKPLYPDTILYSSRIVGGLNMVMIDNSTYQVNEEQLEFYKKQISGPEPVVLYVHIPLYVPSVEKMCCGHPRWGAGSDKNFTIERRERWPESGNRASTVEFVSLVMHKKCPIGIFAGHWHEYHSISSGAVNQHLALPAFKGHYRLIRFQPRP